MSRDDSPDIVPAHLEFLSIYSPDLPEDSQLVYHYARPQRRRRRRSTGPSEDEQQAEDGEEAQRNAHRSMRQIGLAQGMVNFARSFSGKRDIDSIESERHRTVLKELEKGWWILASIRLTRLRSPAGSPPTSKLHETTEEFSAREISPPVVLVEQLLRAHRIFLLHQSHSLSDLYVRLPAAKFSTVLHSYWTGFAESWDVMLHGNPAADALGGIRLAGAGELGIGVGEEEHGSAEREYLEELARATDGLVDLVISRHASADHVDQAGLTDGVIFSGIGALGSNSLRALSEWMARVAAYGIHAYGVTGNPVSARNRPHRQNSSRGASQARARSSTTNPSSSSSKKKRSKQGVQTGSPRPSIPPPLISTSKPPLAKQSNDTQADEKARKRSETSTASAVHGDPDQQGASWMNYLTLGYGTNWGSLAQRPATKGEPDRADESFDDGSGRPQDAPVEGHFLVGLTGPMAPIPGPSDDAQDEEGDLDAGNRLSVRTINVEVLEKADTKKINDSNAESSVLEQRAARSEADGSLVLVKRKLRLIVYQHGPFIYAFLFDTNATLLSMPSFYHGLHEKLQLLYKALIVSTSSDRICSRIKAILPNVAGVDQATAPIFDLIYDPSNLTVRSSIPSIPSFQEDESTEGPASTARWSRLEALNLYTHVIALLSETRDNAAISECSVKTSRNWWVTWMRLSAAPDTDKQSWSDLSETERPREQQFRDAILVRRASDNTRRMREGRRSSAFGRLSLGGGSRGFSRLLGQQDSNSGDNSDTGQSGTGSARVAEGIGVDARQYVEALLRLNR